MPEVHGTCQTEALVLISDGDNDGLSDAFMCVCVLPDRVAWQQIKARRKAWMVIGEILKCNVRNGVGLTDDPSPLHGPSNSVATACCFVL